MTTKYSYDQLKAAANRRALEEYADDSSSVIIGVLIAWVQLYADGAKGAVEARINDLIAREQKDAA